MSLIQSSTVFDTTDLESHDSVSCRSARRRERDEISSMTQDTNRRTESELYKLIEKADLETSRLRE